MDVPALEKALLTGRWVHTPSDHPVAGLCQSVVSGSFKDALSSPQARETFKTTALDVLAVPIHSLVEIPVGSSPERDLIRLSLAVACIHVFVQANWTGPDVEVSPLQVLSLPSEHTTTVTDDDLNRKAIAELAHGGEPAYHLTRHAVFLRWAQVLLSLQYGHCQSIAWWRLRVTALHQQVLDEPIAVPDTIFTSLSSLDHLTHQDPALAGRLLLEKGLLEHQIGSDKSSADSFTRAAESTSLDYELTGALGKRTKFQEHEISQLVVLAQSRLVEDDDQVTSTQADARLPETLGLNDDTLLENTEFKKSAGTDPGHRLSHIDPSSQPALHPLDQCILLALCLIVGSTSPSHGLTSEQMAPYISRIISHPRNWSIHSMALLLRSRLEASRTRTVERSALQLQALVDQMPTADSTLSERLLYFHAILLPSKWEMERELAKRFMSLGVVKSALEIFERLEMWEDVVMCWQLIESKEKAISLVRDLLEGRKQESETVMVKGKAIFNDRRQSLDAAREAKLWCVLGDLEPDNAVQHYTHAWSISKETSGRAVRSLGAYHFAKGDYQKAISYLRRAVAINPLLSRSWFILGCTYLRVEDWQGGREAFSRCVAIDEEDGESWNNLASVYLRMTNTQKTSQSVDAEVLMDSSDEIIIDAPTRQNGDGVGHLPKFEEADGGVPFENKLLAFRALKQGLRYSFDNWRMWANYMVVAMDVGELSEACRALGRIVEETSSKLGAQSVDEDVLERLVDAATRAPASVTHGDGENTAVNGYQPRGLPQRVSDLFEQTILPRVSSPRIFRSYARLLTWQSRWSDALKAYLDGYRCSTAGTIARGEADLESWHQAVTEVEEVVDVLRNFGPRVDGYNWRLQGRSIVRTFLGKTREFEGEPGWSALTQLSEDLRKEG